MPKVSVVSIAKRERELDQLKKALRKQTYKNFEFVFSTKRGIPNAWNDAIGRAKGDIIIITESDCLPLNNKWLEEMVRAIKKTDKKTLIRGVEIQPTPWCWSNIGCHASVLKDNPLDECYPVGEDTELFARLKKKGYKNIELPIAPVIHFKKYKGFSRTVKDYYTYGILLSKIRRKYGFVGFEKSTDKSSFLKKELTIIFSRISYIIGIIRGMI
ncbi:MAG: glycosyltransferase family A protein [Candidatus Aenigmatarchaeota archaeon]